MILAFIFALAQDLPRVPEGWTIELVARAPALKHPSVVCAAPDGRIFVAEDPMDITAPADAALGRILCLAPDGRLSVFAEGLHAVFGMQYLEGRLYVLHNPKYTRFSDDGRERTDLIAQTLPKPWALDWNDHVPANFRLGLDGFVYVAVGDKGLFGCRGRDGSAAELRGGGILRMTPDAEKLEVVSTGVRNILDVAMNAEGDLFTYDNTDEHHWMGRVTHMLEGGFYGYPWDFHPRRPYTLWMLADLGGGAATGALAVEEDAWGPDWKGNLLLADFGKRSVARLRLERDGATWKAGAREDLVAQAGKESFRPVGLALSADGRSLYVCDWAHVDQKGKTPAGRLYRVSGPGLPAPRPAWWAAAASGRPFEAADAELAAALAHPALSVRLTAQRRLSDRGAAAALEARFADRNAPFEARLHALWGLHALGKEPAGALSDADPRLVRQALRARGLRREPVPAAALEHADPRVRFEAATALGRAGDPSAGPALATRLGDPDPTARYAAFAALRRLGAWESVLKLLPGEDPRRREGALCALRGTFATPVVEALAAELRDPLAVEILAGLVRREPPWDGAWWSNAYHPALTPRPRPTLDWEGTPAALGALRAALASDRVEVRRAAAAAWSWAEGSAAMPALRERWEQERDPEVRRTILAAAAASKDAASAGLVASAIRDPALLAPAIAAAEKLGLAGPLIALAGDGSAEARKAAVGALGALRSRDAVPVLLQCFAREDLRFEAAEALAAVPDLRALEAYAWGLAGSSPALRDKCRAAVERLRREHPGKVAALPEPPARSDPQRYFERGTSERGDAARGRALFEDPKGVACAKCHRVAGKGGEVGPDLSAVGGQFSRAELAEHVLWPSRKIREGYGLVKIRTRSGDVIAGAVKEETPARLVLLDAEGRRHELAAADIEARQAGELSLMPEGLERGLSAEQFSDLLEYLQTLR